MAADCPTKNRTGSERSSLDASSYVERWRRELLHLTGCSPGEVADRVGVLLKFCAACSVSPEDMIDQCRHGPERSARLNLYLRAARGSGASLVVQSFLVHSGVNIFGELVCMPATVEATVREQGEQWKRSR